MRRRVRQPAGEDLWAISREVEQALRDFVDRQPVSDFYSLTRYRFGWQETGAHPFQPESVLSILACQACGGTREAALPMAVAVALLEAFVCNQEDLERRRDTRDGRPSVWSVWGVPQAMNAGDAMHALAKVALLEARRHLSAAAILHLQEELDESCLRLCDAVHHELANDAGDDARLAAGRSAVLFGCAAYGGCYIAAGDSDMASRLRRVGELLGSAAGLLPFDPARARAAQAECLAELDCCELRATPRARLRNLAERVVLPS